ncbi:MAG: hypothetical protein K6G11_05390 [Lachnospiraceae bacterium]|nr:hypothetical protein [Lachnospiraceae bacterium]
MSKNNGANAKQIASMYNEYIKKKRATEKTANYREVDKVDVAKGSKNIYSNNAINQSQRSQDIKSNGSSGRIYKKRNTNLHKSPHSARFRYSKSYLNYDSQDSLSNEYDANKSARSSKKKDSISQDFNKNSPTIAIERLKNDTYKSRERYFEDVAYAAAGKIYEEQLKNEGRTTNIHTNKDINHFFSIESIAQDLLKSPAFKNSLKCKSDKNKYVDPKNVARALEDKTKLAAISTYLEDSPTREEVAEKEIMKRKIAEHKPEPKKVAPRQIHNTPKPKARAL